MDDLSEKLVEYKNYIFKKRSKKIILLIIIGIIPYLISGKEWISNDFSFILSAPFFVWAMMELYGMMRILISEATDIQEGTIQSVVGHKHGYARVQMTNDKAPIAEYVPKEPAIKCQESVTVFHLTPKIFKN